MEVAGRRDPCRLHRDQGRQAQARDLLAPIYSSFIEGFATLDLREKALQSDSADLLGLQRSALYQAILLAAATVRVLSLGTSAWGHGR